MLPLGQRKVAAPLSVSAQKARAMHIRRGLLPPETMTLYHSPSFTFLRLALPQCPQTPQVGRFLVIDLTDIFRPYPRRPHWVPDHPEVQENPELTTGHGLYGKLPAPSQSRPSESSSLGSKRITARHSRRDESAYHGWSFTSDLGSLPGPKLVISARTKPVESVWAKDSQHHQVYIDFSNKEGVLGELKESQEHSEMLAQLVGSIDCPDETRPGLKQSATSVLQCSGKVVLYNLETKKEEMEVDTDVNVLIDWWPNVQNSSSGMGELITYSFLLL